MSFPNISYYLAGSFTSVSTPSTISLLNVSQLPDGVYLISINATSATPNGCCGSVRFTKYSSYFGDTTWSLFGDADTTNTAASGIGKLCPTTTDINFVSNLGVTPVVNWTLYKFV